MKESDFEWRSEREMLWHLTSLWQTVGLLVMVWYINMKNLDYKKYSKHFFSLVSIHLSLISLISTETFRPFIARPVKLTILNDQNYFDTKKSLRYFPWSFVLQPRRRLSVLYSQICFRKHQEKCKRGILTWILPHNSGTAMSSLFKYAFMFYIGALQLDKMICNLMK